MTDIFYWTGLVAIFALALIAGKMSAPEHPLKPAQIQIEDPIN